MEQATAGPSPDAAAKPASPASPRHDIYATIHKALRLAMFDAVAASGRTDSTDPEDVTDVVVRVRELLQFCEDHLTTENTLLHPALEARRPGSTAQIAAEHVEHRAAIARLRRAVETLARAPSATRAGVARDLYRELAYFVGENLAHMHEEETHHNRVLWDAYTDAELLALEHAIKAHLTPEQMQRTLRWMLPAMTPAERTGLLSAVRAAAPAPVFDGIVAVARANVDPRGLRKLELALAA